MQDAVEHRDIGPGALPYIERAFDSTSFEVIIKVANGQEIGLIICRSFRSMLGIRKITATLTGGTLEGLSAGRHFIISAVQPIVDELIRGLNENGCYTAGYADDIGEKVSKNV
jgi:hypothetical protein